jgi:AcrR family transcriptional regulator
MARHTTITDDQILDAARAVFVEEGFRARTSKVAQLAGVSEGTIFKRFETKERLFMEALRIPHPAPWYRVIDELVGTGDMRENLVTLGVEMLTFFQQTLPQMLAAAGIKLPPAGPPPGPPPKEGMNLAMQDLDKICGYLEQEQALGRIRETDTKVLATLLFGCFANPILRVSLLRDVQAPEEIRQCAESMIEILWNGIKPDSVDV